MEQLAGLFEVKSHDWWKTKGLILGLVGILGATATIQSIFAHTTSSLVFLMLSCIAWVSVWLYKNRIPKARKHSVGIVICIYSSDPDIDKRIREDFISSLRSSLLKSDVSHFSDIIVLPFHIASRYDNAQEAVTILDRASAHYLVFGLVRKRGDKHILDLTAHVRHKELRSESKQQFSKDISTGWVSRYNLNNADETIELFEITSDIVSLCSQYIIGLAAFASLDLSTSETLFIGVRERIKTKKYPEIPAIREIRKSITHRINQIYLLQARTYLIIWNRTREEVNIQIAQGILKKIFGAYERDGEFLTLSAICEAVLSRDYVKVRTSLQKIKPKKRDAIWYLNMGFVSACQNNEKDSMRFYEEAKRRNDSATTPLTLDKISEFEDFMVWFRDNENPSPLLEYFLGYLNDHFKGDSERATKDYEQFLSRAPETALHAAKVAAEERIMELRA